MAEQGRDYRASSGADVHSKLDACLGCAYDPPTETLSIVLPKDPSESVTGVSFIYSDLD